MRICKRAILRMNTTEIGLKYNKTHILEKNSSAEQIWKSPILKRKTGKGQIEKETSEKGQF